MEDIHVIRTGLLAVNTLIVPIGKEIPKKVFVVDPATSDFSRDSNKVVEYLQKNKLECVGILLTHTHFDHIMGVKVIKDAFPNAKIAVHRAEASEINDAPGKMNCDILSLFQMEARRMVQSSSHGHIVGAVSILSANVFYACHPLAS